MMDAGQITQGLRADVLAQASGQGMNITQLMESGVSFADIMLMIVQNQQGLADAANLIQQSGQMPMAEGNTAEGQDILQLAELFKNMQPQDLQNALLTYDLDDLANLSQIISGNSKEILTDLEVNADNSNLQQQAVQTNTIPEVNQLQDNADKNISQIIENGIDSETALMFEVPNNLQEVYTDNLDSNRNTDINISDNTVDFKASYQQAVFENSGAFEKNTFTVSPKEIFSNSVPFVETQLSQKLNEIFNIISPEIINAYGDSASPNSFTMNLLSELSSNNEVKDSFDFSESMLKVDPLQLAGLLDFISTGRGIPAVSDVSDNEMFKNLENISAVGEPTAKILFNPEEMIKSGEMEIVSYTPAAKNTDAQSSMSYDSSSQNAEETIDFARTMKSVRENVIPEISDEPTEFSQATAAMSAINPDEIAQKMDISFDRAYAELEMNKAKYGSADEQLSKGIHENLEKGRSEFTVKLRPEGLGEILVKLVSDEGGKAVLSMIASSEKTAELLNRDLASLQTSLNQHNVEIENNSVKTVETVMHAQTAFDQYDERRQDEANQQNHFRQLKNKLGNVSDKNASFDAEIEPIAIKSADSALNIKI